MPLCFAYIDLDDFKQVNDKLGHAAGDQALIATARAIDLVLRRVDLKARLGGDEFALLMADTPAEAATDVIDRLAAGLVAAGVAASIGTVVFESPPSDVAAALAAVDGLMYEVKGSRFRRVAVRVVSGPTTPFTPDPVSA